MEERVTQRFKRLTFAELITGRRSERMFESRTTRQMSGRYFLPVPEDLRRFEGRPPRHSLILDRAWKRCVLEQRDCQISEVITVRKSRGD